MLTRIYVRTRLELDRLAEVLRREEGPETIEWVGLAAVVVAVVLGLIAVLPDAFKTGITDLINTWIGQFKNPPK